MNRRILILLMVFCGIFSGWPKIQEAQAAISYVGSVSSTDSNLTSGSFSLPTGWAVGDVAVFWWYARVNTTTFVKKDAGGGITTKQDVNASGYGHIFIGYRTLVAGDSTFDWTSSGGVNVTVIWGTSVFRGVVTAGDPFEAQSGAPATFLNVEDPDPPAVTTVSNNAWVIPIFGKNNDYSAIVVPVNYTSAGSNASSVGTDASAGVAYRQIAVGGTLENPGIWDLTGGAATDDGYVWTGALKPLPPPNVVQTHYRWRNDDGWEASYSYRKLIPINGASGAGTNYQVKIVVGYSSGGDVTCNSNCQPDFDDIRFTDDDGQTFLSYWRESYTASSSATFWVKVNDDLSSNQNIYMYYGNSAASSTSNGGDTFPFFDTFDGSSLKLSKVLDESPYARGGSIALVGSTYHMYYYNQTNILHATSTDLVNWTKDPSNPLITPTQAWEGTAIADPELLRELDGKTPVIYDGKYWLAYTKYASPYGIGIASATDINGPWTKLATNPRLDGTTGQWDSAGVYTNSFVKEGSTYYIFYQGYDGSQWKIGYATASSPDGTWTKSGSNPILSPSLSWEGSATGDPILGKYDSTYYLFYSGGLSTECYNSYAFSSSIGGPYTKSDNLLTVKGTAYPEVLKKDSKYYMITDNLDETGKDLYTADNIAGPWTAWGWTYGGAGSYSIANSQITLTNTKYIANTSIFRGGYAVRLKAKAGTDTTGSSWGGFDVAVGSTLNGNLTLAWYYYDTYTYFIFNSGDGTNYQIINSGITRETANFHIAEARRTGTADRFQIDTDTEKTGNYPTNYPRFPELQAYTADMIVDWILVRKYVLSEPSLGTPGAETAAGGGATWKAAEDGSISNQAKNENIRLRFAIANTAGDSVSSYQYLLEYSTSTGGPWCAVPVTATTEPFEMTPTNPAANYVDNDPTAAAQLTGTGTWQTGKCVEDPSNKTQIYSLSGSYYTEFEYCLLATTNATNGGTYYFRLTNTGTELTSYTNLAQITIAGAVAEITTLGDGTDPCPSTVAPGSTSNYLDQFTFIASSGTDSVTALTVTTANTTAIASMQIWNEAMTTQYFGTVSSPIVDAWTFSGGTNPSIPVTTSSASFRVIFTAKSHAALAAGTYAVTGKVTSYTCTNSKTGTDTDSATITVDNSPPGNATWGTITPGNQQIILNWTNPGADFYRVLILRKIGSAITDAPIEGTEYSVPGTIGDSTIIYVGSGTNFTDTGLTNGTNYYYKIFAYDSYKNYAAGVGTGPHTPTAAPPPRRRTIMFE